MARGQSEIIGVVLMVAVMVAAMSLVGVALVANQAHQIEHLDEPARYDTTINATQLTITHIGGTAYPLSDLDLILRQPNSETRYNLDEPADRLSATWDGDDTFEPGEAVTVAHTASGRVEIVLVETSPPGTLLHDEATTITEQRPQVAPTIDRFDSTDTSSDTDAAFDVTWAASDPQGDLTTVTVTLSSDGTVVDSATTTFGGVDSTGVHTNTLTNSSGSGEVYQITLTVTDAAGHTTTQSQSDTADSDIGLRPPAIETYQVTDTSSGSQVAYDYTYNVSDPDGDLTTVTLELINDTSGVTVDNVTDSYPEVNATGTQTGTLTDPTRTKSDGLQYRVQIIATDLEGNDVTAAVTDVADGGGSGGGTGTPPTIDRFDVTDTTPTTGKNNDATFTVTWRASDTDGNLQNATIQLLDKNANNVLDSVTYTASAFDSGSDTGTQTTTLTDPKGQGKEYVIRLVVKDDTAKSTTISEQHVADGDDTGPTP